MKRILGVMLLCAAIAAQGADVKKSVGKDFPKVNVKNSVSGEAIDLSQILAKAETKGAVVFFSSIKCPYSTGYEERINEIATKYSATVPFLALNANAASEDAAAVSAYTKEKGLKFPVAIDEGSKIAKEIGAGNTPEFYLIDKAGKVVYHGPLDDSFDTAFIKEKYLANAIDAVTGGKAIPAEFQEPPLTKSCNIKFIEAKKETEKKPAAPKAAAPKAPKKAPEPPKQKKDK